MRDAMNSAAKYMRKANIAVGLTAVCGPGALVSATWDEAVRVTLDKEQHVTMLYANVILLWKKNYCLLLKLL